MNFNAFEPGVLIYTIFFFLLLFVTLFRYNKSNIENKKLFTFFMALYCLIGGLRSRWVGSDTSSYIFYFNYIRDMALSQINSEFASRDPLGMIVFKIISGPFQTYTPTLLIIHIVFCLLIAVTYYKYSKNCFLALLIFVFLRYHFFLMSGIRQGFALCLVLYSYKYLIKEKLLKFIIVVVIASMFHMSAILCLLIYPIKNFIFYNKSYKLVLVFIITFVSTLFMPDFVNLVFSDKSGYFTETKSLGNLFSFITSVLVFVYVHVRIQKVHVTKEINLLYNLALGFFILSMLSFKVELAFRAAMYFGFFVPILITYITETKYLIRQVVLMVLLLYMATGVPSSVDPYQFYWNEKYIEKTIE